MYMSRPHGQPLLGSLIQSHRENIQYLFLLDFSQRFFQCVVSKNPQIAEREGDIISGAELDKMRSELGSHFTVCRGITA